MSDFRKELYEKYVSTFKDHVAADNLHIENKSVWKWYDHKYLPKIKEYNSEAAILDIGCGNGNFLDYLRDNGYKNSYGIDISDEQIQIAKSKGLSASTEDLFSFLESTDKKFDIICAMDLVEHLHKEENMKLFKLVYEHLNSGGMFLIHTPNGGGLFSQSVVYGDFTHSTIFTPSSLLQVLSLYGFKNLLFDEAGPVAKNISGAIRLFFWNLIKGASNLVRIIERNKPQKIWTQDFICFAFKK